MQIEVFKDFEGLSSIPCIYIKFRQALMISFFHIKLV